MHPFRATYMLAADLMKDLPPAYFFLDEKISTKSKEGFRQASDKP